MPYGARRSDGGSKSGSSVRLTGLFPTKRRGLFVGGLKADQLDGLIGLLKEAYEQKKGITLFLWQQGRGEGPEYAITADLEREQGERSGGSGGGGGNFGSYNRQPRRRIEQDDDSFGAGDKEERGGKSDFPF